MCVCVRVCVTLLFVPRGQTFLTHSWGWTNIFYTQGGGKHFFIHRVGTNTFYVEGE